MKSIKLIDSQKSKLLKMCKVLFPKYTFEFAKSNTTDSFKLLFSYNTEEYLTFHESEEPYNGIIHWFEFCTKIGYEIFSKKENWYNSEEFKTFMRIMCMQDKTKLSHPIDYLYEQFKQLK